MVMVIPANKVSVTLSTAAQASSVFTVREGHAVTFAVRDISAGGTHSFNVALQGYLAGGWLTLTAVTAPGMYIIQFGSKTETRVLAASVTNTCIAHLSSGKL